MDGFGDPPNPKENNPLAVDDLVAKVSSDFAESPELLVGLVKGLKEKLNGAELDLLLSPLGSDPSVPPRSRSCESGISKTKDPPFFSCL